MGDPLHASPPFHTITDGAAEKDVLALAVARSEAQRILFLITQVRHQLGIIESARMTKIEEAARRIIAVVDHTNQ